jgi:2-polyprenyl-6-methoxyphenol hydroxylase-like FAD-dependent oxidoreductase
LSYDDHTPEATKDANRGNKDYALWKLQESQCPAEIVETVRRSDPESLTIVTRMWHLLPWRLVLGRFQRGAVTVAGDAMHVMGPFNGQGGAAALEDAVVLARSLSLAVPPAPGDCVYDEGAAAADDHRGLQEKKISAAIGRYVRERRPRVTRLSLESFVRGALLGAQSLVKKLVCMAVLAVLGSKSGQHANYDCGRL